MITRNDYMTGNSHDLHRKYYAQFVNEQVKQKVINTWGLDKLLKSKDPYFNDLPLAKWDLMGGWVFSKRTGDILMQPHSTMDVLPIDYNLLKEAGEGLSSATTVCIYKEAAREIVEAETGKTINLE